MSLRFFDMYIVFIVGVVWSRWLARKPGASPWAGRWAWIIGLAFGVSVIGAMFGMYNMLLSPPVQLDPTLPQPEPSALADLYKYSLTTARAFLGVGYVWLVVLTIQNFFSGASADPKPDAS